MFTPYPTRDQVVSATFYFAPILRGTIPEDLPMAINAGWTLAGFAAANAAPLDSHHSMASLTRESAAHMLEQYCSPHTSDEAAALMAIPWQLLLPVIEQVGRELLNRWLEKRRGR